MLRSVLIVACLLTGPPAFAADITGAPTIIDGETLVVGGKRFTLWGIDAPDPRQTCIIRRRDYNCGRISTTALMDLVAGVNVTCRAVKGTKNVAWMRMLAGIWCWVGGTAMIILFLRSAYRLAVPSTRRPM